MADQSNEWSGAVYQIYPRSFNEVRSNPQDLRGEGSLAGIVEKLPYLMDLGVNAIWISPFYPSPMKDGGYDVGNYTDVDKRYGDLQDFRELIDKAHMLGIKVMIDFIPNHTSDQHQWFQESCQALDNPKSDWYIWKDPLPDGSPPNNWASVFSIPQLKARQEGELILPDGALTPTRSAWTFNEYRQQFYLHSFADHQPDLNWHNPEVKEALKESMRFWLNQGVDGFRVDAVNYIGKDPDFTNEELDPNYKEGVDNPYDQLRRFHSTGYPPTFYSNIQELLSVLDEYPGRDLRVLFEAYMDEADLRKIDDISPENSGSFNFTRLDAPWSGPLHKQLLDRYHSVLSDGALPNQVNGNHDKPRLATRIGSMAARTAAVANITLPGMIFIYNGEEGGFTNVVVPEDKQDDVLGGRDPVRTPMLWNNAINAGFSSIEPDELWLPIDPDYKIKNLEVQSHQLYSSLNLYRSLLRLRNGSPTLTEGQYHPLYTNQPDVVAFARRHKGHQVTTLLNFSGDAISSKVWRAEHDIGRIILTSHTEPRTSIVSLESGLTLYPHEGAVVIASA